MAKGTPETTGRPVRSAVAASGQEALEAYRHEKLELAGVLLSLMHIAEARHDGERSEHIRGISARLAEDRFQLAVVGQFSRGKSTLMNAVLGHDYLPTGALPMTSVITTVVYGSRPKATVWRGEGSAPIETPLSELVRYVAQASRERPELGVRSALIALPAEVLRLGFSFVDTPGVGSAILANTKATQGFVPQADAVIFVTSFDSPLSEAELAFLRFVRDEVKRIFVVLNKRDLVSDAEASEIEAFVLARLTELGIERPDVFALSARDGLVAKLNGDLPGVLNSGLQALEMELTDYLTTEKARELLLRVGERAEKVMVSFSTEARAASALASDGAAGVLVGEFVDSLLQRLDAERSDLVSALRETTLKQKDQFLQETAPGLVAALLSVVGPEVDLLDKQEREGDVGAHFEVLASRTGQTVREWADVTVGGWFGGLENAAEPLLSGLSSIPGELVSQTSRRFGTVAVPVGDGVSDRLSRIMPVRVEWTVPVPRNRAVVRSRKRSAALLRKAVHAAAEGYVQRLTGAASRSMDRWLAEIGMWSEAELLGAGDRVKERLATPADDKLENELAALASAIAASRSRLRSWSTVRASAVPGPRSRSASTQVARRGSGCAVCEQLVRALFEFMSHYQFELATRMGARLSHAKAKGFCAVHTWYYEHIGSPIGISQAYAPLAEATAKALFAAAAGTSSPAELQDAISRASRADCAACARLNSARLDVLRHLCASLERSGSPPEVPALCLGHAAEVVSLGLDATLAREVVSATAGRLKRRSEDMRTYSLKRQSLRRRFIDEEEEKAYRDVLLGLVGHPLLACAIRDEGSD
jgi:GTPase SAR1 family protein